MFGKKFTTTVQVEGMMCEHCAGHVQEALAALDGVKKVTVSLANKQAVVVSAIPLGDKAIKDAIAEAGYKVTGIC